MKLSDKHTLKKKQGLKEAYLQSNEDLDRLEAIKEWEILNKDAWDELEEEDI